MPDFDVSKWPPVYQLFAAIGAALAGAAVWLLGNRGKGGGGSTDRMQAQLDTAQLRRDLEEVLRANREAFYGQLAKVREESKDEIDQLERRVRQNEIDIAVLQDRRHS